MADQPQAFRAGSAWSYSNPGYILLGLVVEAVTGHTLAEELDQGIFRPLGLRDSLLPGNDPDIPPPRSSGYSLPLGPPGQVPDDPLLDLTVQNPSWAEAAGWVSTLGDLTRFFRALLDGRLLPPRLLTEMLPAVTVPSRSPPLPLYDQYGLGLLEVETPAGRLVGNVGGIPGFEHRPQHPGRPPAARRDGQRAAAPDPMYEAFIDGSRRWACGCSRRAPMTSGRAGAEGAIGGGAGAVRGPAGGKAGHRLSGRAQAGPGDRPGTAGPRCGRSTGSSPSGRARCGASATWPPTRGWPCWSTTTAMTGPRCGGSSCRGRPPS